MELMRRNRTSLNTPRRAESSIRGVRGTFSRIPISIPSLRGPSGKKINCSQNYLCLFSPKLRSSQLYFVQPVPKGSEQRGDQSWNMCQLLWKALNDHSKEAAGKSPGSHSSLGCPMPCRFPNSLGNGEFLNYCGLQSPFHQASNRILSAAPCISSHGLR